MNLKLVNEHRKLSRLWTARQATPQQKDRCMELARLMEADRQAKASERIRNRLQSSGLY